MKPVANRRWDSETLLVVQLAACVSLAAFFYYLRHGDILLYGDAVAHINIARRVFDSRTPGLLQLGTVWLPLPHLLMIPFLLSDWMWRTGIGGSIPSLFAYVFGTVGVFRLVRGALASSSGPTAAVRVAAWTAAIIFAANPNLIYLQTTAMTEPLYLAFFIWTVVYFADYVRASRLSADERSASSSLLKCGLCLAGACLTRYDGWFLAVVIGLAALGVTIRTTPRRFFSPSFLRFALITAAVPILWLTYNAVVYRNPLEFAIGPYSAKAIELKTATPGAPPHPGTHNFPVAATFFLKSAEMNFMVNGWHRLWLALLLAGTVLALLVERRIWPLVLLWTPLPFYMLSIAYGGVPIFMPVWWPYSIYNARYGIQLLPVFAVFVSLAGYFFSRVTPNRTYKATIAIASLLLIAASYGYAWYEQPISFQEASINARTRMALEHELARNFNLLPPHSSFLMYLGDHVGALQVAGIPLRRVIYEGNHRTWKQPSDPQGLWERALAAPEQYVDYVIAMDRDAVAVGVEKQHLAVVAIIHVHGQPNATIYRTLQ